METKPEENNPTSSPVPFAIKRFLTDESGSSNFQFEEEEDEQPVAYMNCTMRGRRRPPLRSLKLPIKAMTKEGLPIPIFTGKTNKNFARKDRISDSGRQPQGVTEDSPRQPGRGRARVLREKIRQADSESSRASGDRRTQQRKELPVSTRNYSNLDRTGKLHKYSLDPCDTTGFNEHHYVESLDAYEFVPFLSTSSTGCTSLALEKDEVPKDGELSTTLVFQEPPEVVTLLEEPIDELQASKQPREDDQKPSVDGARNQTKETEESGRATTSKEYLSLPSIANCLKKSSIKSDISAEKPSKVAWPKIIIDNLPPDCDKDNVTEILDNYGTVIDVVKEVIGGRARITASMNEAESRDWAVDCLDGCDGILTEEGRFLRATAKN